MNLILVAALLILIDIPWLTLNMPNYQQVFKSIQGGSELQFRVIGAVPVYLALAYLISKANSLTEAGLIGSCTYAVYDFTNYATFGKYPLWLAVMDSLWGGALFMIAYWVIGRFRL